MPKYPRPALEGSALVALERETESAKNRLEAADAQAQLYRLMVAALAEEQARPGEAANAMEGLREAEEVKQEALANYEQCAQAHADKEAELLEAGTHPAQWVEQHGSHAALHAKIVREQFLRPDIQTANAIESIVASPPEYVLDALGPRPEGNVRDAMRWDGLVRDCAEADVANLANPERPVRAMLNQRVKAWRADQGLDGPEAATGDRDIDRGFDADM